MSSELVPHTVTLHLPAEHTLVGLVSLRVDPAVGWAHAVGHRLDSGDLPPNTPALLRRLADELEIAAFMEALNDIAPPA